VRRAAPRRATVRQRDEPEFPARAAAGRRPDRRQSGTWLRDLAARRALVRPSRTGFPVAPSLQFGRRAIILIVENAK